MQTKRTTFLTAILVVLVLAYLAKPVWEVYNEGRSSPAHVPTQAPPPPALPGENSISNIEISRNEQGQWVVGFDYFYTGAPAGATLTIEMLGGSDLQKAAALPQSIPYIHAERGKHRITRELTRPQVNEAVTASSVRVRLFTYKLQTRNQILQNVPVDLFAQSLPVNVDWPDYATARILDDLRSKTPEEFLKTAVELIDEGNDDGLSQARQRLDHLLQKHPQFHPAYLELARVAMKANWGPEGLRQAESYIDAARKINAEDPNVWILQAYVYTYQKRYKEAEPLLVAASKTDTPNLWLWTNWGEFYSLQGKSPQAIEMFQKAVDHPPSGNTYDRARQHAYRLMLRVLEGEGKLDRAEALYAQRAQDYRQIVCYGVEHAQFLLMKRGNAARALEIGSQPLLAECRSPDTKEILGMAYYLSWAQAGAADRPDLLNRARILFPTGSRLMYRLASSDQTSRALKDLLAAGDSIDQMDNRKMTALAYALSTQNYDVARRLLKLRARADLPIGEAEVPVALIPVMADDYAGIRLLRQFGVDYSRLKYRDMTAIDHAKRISNRKLLEALEERGQRL